MNFKYNLEDLNRSVEAAPYIKKEETYRKI